MVAKSIKIHHNGCMKRDNSRHLKYFKILGKNIRTRREELHISQEELAFRISSTRNYIGCIERAEKCPSLAIIIDIANALNCSVNDLVRNL